MCIFLFNILEHCEVSVVGSDRLIHLPEVTQLSDGRGMHCIILSYGL